MSTITATNLHGDTIRKTGGSLGVDIRLKNNSVYESDGGTSVTQNLVQGLCKHWVDIDNKDTAVTVRDSLNHSSATDIGTGNYLPYATNPFSNVNYVILGSTIGGVGNQSVLDSHQTVGVKGTGGAGLYEVGVSDNNNGDADNDHCMTAAMGDLA